MDAKQKYWADLFGAEWPRIQRYGQAIVDPDEKKVFWDSIKEAKRQDPHWSFDSVHPQRTPKNMAQKYCGEILKMLRGKPKEEESA